MHRFRLQLQIRPDLAQKSALLDLELAVGEEQITDIPAPEHVRVKAFSHLLGESETSFFAPPALASRLRRQFPASLKDAPALLPAPNTALRRGIDEWCAKQELRLRVIGEFEDTALMKVFCQATPAVFPAPAAIEQGICRFYGVRVVGRTSGVKGGTTRFQSSSA